eukprot:CAMPEP_0176228900 /NCGR_PEP_ID=MMETSP0121_2-20121125/23513_1 /TAXON_ID=160619 /ORGANISM="Kryptoperidinium foliaceum, Strain CCMP 1326" /LENGTH=303 /DNA_ID=CAMNT_0017568209 /DNA_START=78 /DNA_END=986 /DNA_ORIENTATION=-
MACGARGGARNEARNSAQAAFRRQGLVQVLQRRDRLLCFLVPAHGLEVPGDHALLPRLGGRLLVHRLQPAALGAALHPLRLELLVHLLKVLDEPPKVCVLGLERVVGGPDERAVQATKVLLGAAAGGVLGHDLRLAAEAEALALADLPGLVVGQELVPAQTHLLHSSRAVRRGCAVAAALHLPHGPGPELEEPHGRVAVAVAGQHPDAARRQPIGVLRGADAIVPRVLLHALGLRRRGPQGLDVLRNDASGGGNGGEDDDHRQRHMAARAAVGGPASAEHLPGRPLWPRGGRARRRVPERVRS